MTASGFLEQLDDATAQRSADTASITASGSNASAGMTMHEPWLVQARLPMTMPKQW